MGEAMEEATEQTIAWGGWPNCLRLASGTIELVVTRDVGPRVVRFGRPGGPNEFREFPEQQGRAGGDEWRVLGGHRLWHAPEQMPRSYQPDNAPVECVLRPGGAALTQPVEAATGIEKRLDLQIRDGGRVVVTHGLTNRGVWPVRVAPWGLSVMAPGGTAVIPQPPLETPDHLLPNRSVALWPYTPAGDPRLCWGERFLRVRCDAARPRPIKIGTQATCGWCAYVNGGRAFVKRVTPILGMEYPDLGSGIECYTAGDFLELETLGPLVLLEPGQSTSHVEQWFLLEGVDAADEEALERTLAARVPDLPADP